MAIEKISVEKFMDLAKDHPVIDVRSPGEYSHAHIPGAISLPLFTDEERKIVGTTYKQESRQKAIKIGLEFFGPKMRKMIEEVELAMGNRQQAISNSSGKDLPIANCILIYCWRGGMRSAGVAWLMDLYGFKVYTLAGGYKKFRNYVLDIFKRPFQFKILGGFTGSGKTETLHALKEKGESIIDLEDLANHKGSAFGNIGLPQQPTQEMFENLLAMELKEKSVVSKSVGRYDNDPLTNDLMTTLWLEDESQRIGLINIPGDIWSIMRRSPIYFLDIPFEERLEHIVREYGSLDKQPMIEAIGRIREKLGGLHAQTAIQLLEDGLTLECFRILLAYYDRFYFKALHNRERLDSLLKTIECQSITSENAQLLVNQSKFQPERS